MTRSGTLGVLVWGAILLLSGCAAVVSSTTGGLADGIDRALVDQNDPETVRQGAPAYLVLIDGLIDDRPRDAHLLLAGAELYSSYAFAFAEDAERAKRLALKGRDYGFRGLCARRPKTCDVWTRPYDEFEATIDSLGAGDVPSLFTVASAWATWIQVNHEDWVAIADKARVEAMIQRVVTLAPDHAQGAPYVYLGVLATLLPEALGGQPEEGRRAFERATEVSQGRNLQAKVLEARQYARLKFDRELHDRLCREVLESPAEVPGLTLSNMLAKEEARRLLAESADYFGE